MQEHQVGFVPKRYDLENSASAKALSAMNEACILFSTERSIDTSWPMEKFDHIARAVISELYKGPYVGLNCNELLTNLMKTDIYRKEKRPESFVHLAVFGFIYDLIESDIIVANFPGRRELTLSPYMRQILDVSLWANQEVSAKIEADLDKIVKSIPVEKEPSAVYLGAVAAGFKGTEEQFLQTLKGDTEKPVAAATDDDAPSLSLLGINVIGKPGIPASANVPQNCVFIGAVIGPHSVRPEDMRIAYEHLKVSLLTSNERGGKCYYVILGHQYEVSKPEAEYYVKSFKALKRALKKV